MNLKDEIQRILNSHEECEGCSLAINLEETPTDPAVSDCRLMTAKEFALHCPAIETTVQEQAFEEYQRVLDDGGFLPVHITHTKQTVFRSQRNI